MNPSEKLIKSKERVRSLAEVFTAEREVNAMLNLIPSHIWENIDSTFLEPSCGDGNFIEAIIVRKLKNIQKPKQIKKNQTKLEYQILKAVSSVYGIDICSENIKECKERIEHLVKSFYSNNFNTINPSDDFKSFLHEMIDCNYIQGDTLNEPEKITIVKWDRPVDFYFKKTMFRLSDLSSPNPQPYLQEKLKKFNGK